MNTRRVCLVTPRHLYANPRLVKEAEALTEAGYDVRIVCGQYAPAAREHDDQLADPRWNVTRVRFGPFEAERMRYLQQTARRHAARTVARVIGAREQIAEVAHAPATPELTAAAAAEPADLYIAHYTAALPAAATAAARHKSAYAYDAEDFHLGELPDTPANAFEKDIIRSIESRRLRGAAYVTAAAPLIADAYVETYGIERPTVVLNTFPKSNAPELSARGSAAPGPSVYWFSQTVGEGRGLEAAVQAIARAKSAPHLYLRGQPSPGFEERLRGLAEEHNVLARLHLLPPAPPRDLERLGAQYDIGLSGETGFSRNNGLALGNKLFSYLCSGLPIVASDTPAHQRFAQDLEGALSLFAVNDPQSLASAIDALLLDPHRLASARERAWRLAQERYCWDVEKRVFLDLVERALARSPDYAHA